MEAEDADEDLLGNNDLFDRCLLHHPVSSTEDSARVVDLKISDNDTSDSLNAKRKLESGHGLFCVMKKRICRQYYVDGTFPDLDDAEKRDVFKTDFTFEHLMEHPNDLVDESASDTDLSECSEFDVISLHVFPTEDKGTLASKFSSESRSSSLVLSSEVNDENGVGIFKTDGDTSSASEFIYGDVFNKQGSIENMSRSDDLKLWKTDGEPIPISIVPPDCELSLLQESCSPHQIFICKNEYNLHDDNLGHETSPSPLIKSLEGPSRPWSVCGSIDAVTNVPVLETRSGACSSLGEQLDLNLGSSEKMDVEVAQTALALYQAEVHGEADEPIPISIVPPDCGSSLLLESCSLHQIFRRKNEYNLHDDNLVLEISPLPLIKTLERPSRPWSVCGSVDAVTNISFLETRSGACSSLDEQLDLNPGSSENMDAEVAQTASTLYQEEVDGGDEICFSDIDAMILKLNLVPDDSDSCLNREEWNMSQHPRHALPGLEYNTRTSIQRGIMSQGAMAVLNCRDSKHFIRKHEVIIGRSCDGLNVDIDLGKYGYGSKISRLQALIKLENSGSFSLMNLGKRHILVNGEKLNKGEIATLSSCSSINIRDIVFVFKINKEAVRQFLKKNIRRNIEDDTKFRWCE